MLERASIKNTVLMDGEDIALILNEMISFPETLDKKFMPRKPEEVTTSTQSPIKAN